MAPTATDTSPTMDCHQQTIQYMKSRWNDIRKAHNSDYGSHFQTFIQNTFSKNASEGENHLSLILLLMLVRPTPNHSLLDISDFDT